MTSYLVVTRAAIILWISLAVMPVALVFDSIEANWSAAASSCSRIVEVMADGPILKSGSP
jgi:hypothetical protein